MSAQATGGRRRSDSPPAWIGVLLAALAAWCVVASACGGQPLRAESWQRPAWSAGAVRGDHCDTRCEELAARCDVRSPGRWPLVLACRDAYAGTVDVAPSSEWQLDHELPARVVWGLRDWRDEDGTVCVRAVGCAEFSRRFNDPENLSVTTARSNARKGTLMPGSWCPGTRGDRVALAASVKRTATKWRIPLAHEDRAGIAAWARGECLPRQRVIGGRP